MRISEIIIPGGYVGQKSPISGKNPIPKKKQAAIEKVEELVDEQKDVPANLEKLHK